MANQPSILCPIDFSEPSRAALSYAAAIADHFGARLMVLTVDDPLLTEVTATTGRVPSLARETENELRRFVADTLPQPAAGPKTMDFRVAVGKPAAEILRAAQGAGVDLIVMSSHGRSGVRKMFFGSTTERVLRETTVPVLVSPAGERVGSLSQFSQQIHRIIVPVDLTPTSLHQVKVAAGLASALSTPLIVAHVMEPVFVPATVRLVIPGSEATRRHEMEERLATMVQSVASTAQIETLVVTGDPSEEIVRLAETRDARVIVMGLHSSGLLGPRMGSVTYRVLCLTRSLVLALPPLPDASSAAAHSGSLAGVLV